MEQEALVPNSIPLSQRRLSSLVLLALLSLLSSCAVSPDTSHVPDSPAGLINDALRGFSIVNGQVTR